MINTIDDQSFIDYWNAVDEALMAQFCIDSGDAGIEPDMIAMAQEEGQTPEEFALWFGQKYDLTRIGELTEHRRAILIERGRRASGL